MKSISVAHDGLSGTPIHAVTAVWVPDLKDPRTPAARIKSGSLAPIAPGVLVGFVVRYSETRPLVIERGNDSVEVHPPGKWPALTLL